MKKSVEFGSAAWADEVFSLPPARIVKGRTRWTHRHAPWVAHLKRFAYVESRNELIAMIALEYLHRQKQVLRFKEQPFTTDEALFGYTYTPDFLAESATRQRYAIEIKTKRFVSRELEAQLDKRKAEFAEHGQVKFLVWTDHNPLTHPLRHNLLTLRRTSNLNIEADELARLVELMGQRNQLPLWALIERGFDSDLIAYACWTGHLFLRLTEPINEQSLVSVSPQEDLAALLFSAEPDLHAFWNALEDAA